MGYSPNSPNSPLAFVAIQAALNAGQLLRKGFGTTFSVTSKENALDLVTAYDHAAEELIINFIKEQFPDHAFLAEESGPSDGEGAPVRWIIDPLDGTLNFAHHIPIFAVSIAAMIGDRTEVGVIYQPMYDELFVAQIDRGAYLNGVRLHVSAVADMQYAVGATGFPYGVRETRHECISQFVNFLEIGNPIRIIGSAALNLAYVAAGRFDACWGSNWKPWDVAAGRLLVEEANGRVTNYAGDPHDMFNQSSIIATNALLHESVIAFLK